MPLRIILADDHQILREGLKALLEREGFAVVGEASDGREAVRLARELHPDVVVLDLTMPLLNGLDAAKEIRQDCPRTKSVLLSMHSEDRYVLEALRAGVSGYVLKSKAASGLIEAIREAVAGNIYLSPTVSRPVVDAFLGKIALPADPLSPRERQVLQLIAEGKTTKEIATVLNISVKTAASHRTKIMEKLQIHDVAALVRYAVRQGIIQP